MIIINSCPFCAGKNIIPHPQVGVAPFVKHEIIPGVEVEASVISRYSVCQNCKIIFQNPRLSNDDLEKFYSQGYYRKTLNLSDEEKDNDEMLRAKTDSEIIKQNIGNIDAHLDIGCSRGFLLKEVGAKVKAGVEPDIDNVTISGIKLYPNMDKIGKKTFDLVTAIHVLEHEPDPITSLRKMSNFVSREGTLVVEVPTWKSPGGPFRLPHLFHFEPDVLRMMCAEVGLKVIDTFFTPHLLLICKRKR